MLGLFLIALSCDQQPPPPPAPDSLGDPRLQDLRAASESWRDRQEPPREIVDTVCLVPDVPTFLEVIATWDEAHFFPILIDDAELVLKFVRAFRPAQVVRYPKRVATIPHNLLWARAVEAVGRAWTASDAPQHRAGDRWPSLLDASPGIVFSAPESPSLAGAVALAAGRFQPLARWDNDRRFTDELKLEEARGLAAEVEAQVAAIAPEYSKLGDRCDFLTLAGDWPYRYCTQDGPSPGRRSFDDLLGRDRSTGRRWAYVGRLIGGPAASVYQAMCSLFLQPHAATLFNAYTESQRPWTDYDMASAAESLESRFSVRLRQGFPSVGIEGWHDTFGLVNRTGLVLVNTSGSPDVFNLPGGQDAQTGDLPLTEPAAVVMVHSFSAAAPHDPDTLAGRWLANGGFIYFGAVDEPFLQAFRRPALVGRLIADHLPFAAALRATPHEPFGTPWRLIYLGDPLYRLLPSGLTQRARVVWEPLAHWPAYRYSPLSQNASDPARLAWALRTAIVHAAQPEIPIIEPDLAETLLGINRGRLPVASRAVLDALLADTLASQGHAASLVRQLVRLPRTEVRSNHRRWMEAAAVLELNRALETKDWVRALDTWNKLVRFETSDALRQRVTRRMSAAAAVLNRLANWHDHLAAAIRDRPGCQPLVEEQVRVNEKLKTRG